MQPIKATCIDNLATFTSYVTTRPMFHIIKYQRFKEVCSMWFGGCRPWGWGWGFGGWGCGWGCGWGRGWGW